MNNENEKSPIDVLKHNIVKAFEDIDENNNSTLANAVGCKKINPVIEYLQDEDFRTPYAKIDEKIMGISEVFCSYMWCISYFLFFVSEELNKEQINSSYTGGFNFNKTHERSSALKLFNWALSLKTSSSSWDTTLANPKDVENLSDLEKYYIPKVNNIWSYAIAFVFYHEYAHIVLNHTISLGEYGKEQEKEADQYSREKLLHFLGAEKENTIGGLGIVIGTLSLLFLQKTDRPLCSKTHPETDLRLQFSYEWLNQIEDKTKREYLKQMVINGCLIYFSIENIPYETGKPTKDIDKEFSKILKIFDKLNSKQ